MGDVFLMLIRQAVYQVCLSTDLWELKMRRSYDGQRYEEKTKRISRYSQK
jgi:hypothetical protein